MAQESWRQVYSEDLVSFLLLWLYRMIQNQFDLSIFAHEVSPETCILFEKLADFRQRTLVLGGVAPFLQTSVEKRPLRGQRTQTLTHAVSAFWVQGQCFRYALRASRWMAENNVNAECIFRCLHKNLCNCVLFGCVLFVAPKAQGMVSWLLLAFRAAPQLPFLSPIFSMARSKQSGEGAGSSPHV